MSADDIPAIPAAGPRLFLDSADPADWEALLPAGIFHGVTCNPLLLERAGQACTAANLASLAAAARSLGAREIHLQCWGETEDELFETGSRLALLGDRRMPVAVKVPATATGFRAARRLRNAGCRLTLTAVYGPGQLLAAAAAGAAYAAPYLGRMNDAGRDGRTAILEMHRILQGTGAGTRLLVASLRSAEWIVDLAAAGLDTFTFGAPVAWDLLKDGLTDEAAADFQRAAREGGA